MSARCRSCRAEIVWAVTASGKKMPINAAVDPLGLYVLRQDSDGVMRAVGKGSATAEETEFHQPHFATCPQSKDWSRK